MKKENETTEKIELLLEMLLIIVRICKTEGNYDTKVINRSFKEKDCRHLVFLLHQQLNNFNNNNNNNNNNNSYSFEGVANLIELITTLPYWDHLVFRLFDNSSQWNVVDVLFRCL